MKWEAHFFEIDGGPSGTWLARSAAVVSRRNIASSETGGHANP